MRNIIESAKYMALVVALGSTFGAGATGCGEHDLTPVETGVLEQDLYWTSGRLWPTRTINVCFETSAHSTERKRVKGVIKGQRSWEHSAGVIFTGFNICSSNAKGIRIDIDASNAPYSQVGYESVSNPYNSDIVAGVTRVWLPTEEVALATVPVCQSSGWTAKSCFRQVALHEFGHALSLAHEQEREPALCPSAGYDPSLPGDSTWGLFDRQSIMAYPQGQCTPGENLSVTDQQGIDRMYGPALRGERRLGDYDGDGRADLLCHDAVSGHKFINLANSSGHFWSTNWKSEDYTSQGWCGATTDRLYKGDFDLDGRTDLLCHDVVGGSLEVSKAQFDYFEDKDIGGTTVWCNNQGEELFVGDFNGDGRDDLLCHQPNGAVQIDFADGLGSFLGTNTTSYLGYCSGADQRLYVGSFNDDAWDDLFCHDLSDGGTYIVLGTGAGQFAFGEFNGNANWCNTEGSQMLIGNFDGDGRDDLLCHNGHTGQVTVKIAGPWGYFTDSPWQSSGAPVCSGGDQRLYTGDTNLDGNDDLICHSVETGSKQIFFADNNGHFTGTPWTRTSSWCGMTSRIVL